MFDHPAIGPVPPPPPAASTLSATAAPWGMASSSHYSGAAAYGGAYGGAQMMSMMMQQYNAMAYANAPPCRFGDKCTRPDCVFSHPEPSHHEEPAPQRRRSRNFRCMPSW